MKYFEIYQPKYALIKAIDKGEAIKLYKQKYREDEGLEQCLEEVKYDYALAKYCIVSTNLQKVTPAPEVVVTHFNYGRQRILLESDRTGYKLPSID